MKNMLVLFAFLVGFSTVSRAQSATPPSQPIPASQSLRPTITHKEKARYTQAALDEGIHGWVLISAVFRADGKLSDVTPLTQLPHGLTEMAVEAAQKIRFKPAMKEGQPVSVRMSMEFFFALEYRDKRHQKRVIAFAFPYLDNESIEKLVQVFDQHKPDTYTTDLWLVGCEKRGMRTFPKAERDEYAQLQAEALQRLSPERQKSVQRLLQKEHEDKIENDDLYAFSRLIFEGLARSPAEKQTRYKVLHNRAVLAGLEKFEAK